jgi:Flp pilus assembly protein TadG
MRALRLLRRWGADRGGATAVEFAIIGPIFLLLVTACIEFGIQLMTQLALDNATQAAARQLEIGQVTARSDFVAQICSNASALLSNCSSQLQVNVASASSFASLTPATVKNGALSPAAFSPGGSQADVLVQVAYTRPYDVQWLASLAGTTPTLVSTVAVQNEPSSS